MAVSFNINHHRQAFVDEVMVEPPAPVGFKCRIWKHHPNHSNSPKSKLNPNRSKSKFIRNIHLIRTISDRIWYSDWNRMIFFPIRIIRNPIGFIRIRNCPPLYRTSEQNKILFMDKTSIESNGYLVPLCLVSLICLTLLQALKPVKELVTYIQTEVQG